MPVLCEGSRHVRKVHRQHQIPYRQAIQLPFQIEKLIVQLKPERPSWGAPIPDRVGSKVEGTIRTDSATNS
jgi:hypothetical protein